MLSVVLLKERSTITTVAPAFTRTSAVASPMPEAAPVITANLAMSHFAPWTVCSTHRFRPDVSSGLLRGDLRGCALQGHRAFDFVSGVESSQLRVASCHFKR
jgi:hypothetical protein